ncbi:MAG: hypothetical protein KAH20_08960 [Methylococcales bacterium]|nr:hypothetical protein [Methylococcales bacterium]
MIYRASYLFILSVFFTFSSLNIGIINSANAEQKPDSNKIQGKVADVIDVATYTYIEVDTGTSKVWAAAPTSKMKIGDSVTISTEMPMKDFYSDSINRTFPLIYFVDHFMTDAGEVTVSDKPSPHSKIKPVRKSLKGVDKIKGGKNIAEIHVEKDSLKGKTIQVRGQVTRFAAEVMGKNWLHIQDSSGFDDLTVTTDKIVAIGDIVIVEGKLELDKDFSYGYIYPLIIQDAKVTKE